MRTAPFKRAARQQRVGKISRRNNSEKGTTGFNVRMFAFALICVALLFLGHGGYRVANSNGATTQTDESFGVRGSSSSSSINTVPKKEVYLQNQVTTKKYSHNFPEPPPTDKDGTRYHVVFSTSCSDLTHWQSYLLFYQALKVQQIGNITRIASSCSDEQIEREKTWHEEHIRSQMSDRFNIHFTPMFMNVKNEDGSDTGKNYKFFNKPFGLRHWMEHGEGMGVDPNTGKMVDEDVVIILLDPDMALLRPITVDFSDESATIISGPVEGRASGRVEHGYPYAQWYAFGSQWMHKIDIAKVAGKDSPAISVKESEAGKNYPVGPPYVATSRDMYAIATHWSDFVPAVHKQYPELLAEMFAFCIAAAHLKLPHIVVDHLMVSDPNVGSGEGFKFIENIPDGQTCKTGYNHVEYDGPLPNVMHFCQRYIIKDWMFAKHRPALVKFFTCESPLLKDPPMDLEDAHYAITPGGTDKKDLSKSKAKQNAFMVCGLHAAMNEAGELFKKNHCGGKGEKTLQLFYTF